MKDLEKLYSRVNSETLLDFSPSDIKLGKDNYSCAQIIDMLENNEINLDTIFQRKAGLWNEVQKSKFIESMMLRFPIPPLYFNVVYKDKNEEFPFWEVIDGLQRLYTIKEFTKGINGKQLKLCGLDFYPELDGKKIDEVPRHLITKFKACQLQLHLVYPNTPTQVILRIFERINTTSLKLTEQEVRNAIYQGPIVNYLKEDANYLESKGIVIDSKRHSNSEVILRFYAIYCFGIKKYTAEGKLSNFLNKSMRALNELNDDEIQTISKEFRKALNIALEIFKDKAFRGKGNRFNRTIFEAKLILISKLNDVQIKECLKNKDKIIKDYIKFLSQPDNERFIKSISNATSRSDNIEFRYSILQSIIKG